MPYSVWFPTIGLALDLIAFGILSADLVRTLNNERLMRDENLDLERAVYEATYAVFGPDSETMMKEDEAFRMRQTERREKTDRDMWRRRVWATLAIALALVGAVFQIYGSWPTQG